MNKDEFMDEAIIALLKSMQEFSEAYFNLKKKAQEHNCFIDGLEIYKVIEENPIYTCEIETDYEKINQDYALVLEEAGDCKAYIRVIYEDEES